MALNLIQQVELAKIIAKAETEKSIKEDVKKYGKKKFVADVVEYIERNYSERVHYFHLKDVFQAMHK